MIKLLNNSITFIEDNILEDIDWSQWCLKSSIDEYHFRTVFFHITGITLTEYVRKRRLSHAHNDLEGGGLVTTVAFKYLYLSIDGFTRAFKKEFGYLPSEVGKYHLKQLFTKLHFSIEVSGGNNMEYKIIELPAFTFAGVKARVPMQFEGVNQEIVKLAHSITNEQKVYMHSLKNTNPKEIVNVSYNADYMFKKEDGYLTHMIGVLTTHSTINDILDTLKVEKCQWAVFPNEGIFPKTLQDTMSNIYSKWLPVSEYLLLPYPTFSFTKMNNDGINAYSEIWIPVKYNNY